MEFDTLSFLLGFGASIVVACLMTLFMIAQLKGAK